MQLNEMLDKMVKFGGSDLHFLGGEPPLIRIDGKLEVLQGYETPLSNDEVKKICAPALNDRERREFIEKKELDFMVQTSISRFRTNYYVALEKMGAAFRVIPTKIPSIDDLKAPQIYKELIKREKGLILVTGPTGSGKSTTLAAMLNEINLTENKHILTIEDPVEFVHQNKQSLFSQRSVGSDTMSFANALKSALRQDPDIILIGEMRNKETIKAAITAAETGHLVFSTLHTNSAVATINRILDTFEADERPQISAQLSATLVAGIAQALLPKVGGGRVAVSEILINNPALGNLIREGKIHQLYSQMQIGQGGTGMQTQTQEMLRLIGENKITKDNALRFSTNQEELKKALG